MSEPVISSQKHDWGDLPTGWENLPDIKDAWGEPTPEVQKAWEDELASLPTLDELMNKPPVKGQKKGEKQ